MALRITEQSLEGATPDRTEIEAPAVQASREASEREASERQGEDQRRSTKAGQGRNMLACSPCRARPEGATITAIHP